MMSATKALSGKLVLVTGAASGIGKSVCELFARNGASVVGADLQQNVHQVISGLGSEENAKHTSYELDVTNENGISKMMTDILQQYKSTPSIAVNSAGITKDTFLLKMTEKEFDQVIDINLKGTFLVTKHVCNNMISNKIQNGSIVNISSVVGKVGNIGQVNYAASKAGVIGLTKTVAQEMARYKIRCNAILPGFIETPMTDVVPEQLKEGVKAMIPLKCFGEPSDIAEACLFLASDKSRYITATSLEVAGGLFA